MEKDNLKNLRLKGFIMTLFMVIPLFILYACIGTFLLNTGLYFWMMYYYPNSLATILNSQLSIFYFPFALSFLICIYTIPLIVKRIRNKKLSGYFKDFIDDVNHVDEEKISGNILLLFLVGLKISGKNIVLIIYMILVLIMFFWVDVSRYSVIEGKNLSFHGIDDSFKQNTEDVISIAKVDDIFLVQFKDGTLWTSHLYGYNLWNFKRNKDFNSHFVQEISRMSNVAIVQ